MTTQNTDQGTVTVRKAADRGEAEFGWLHSRHSFSFGEYVDPDHTGFRSLRVINDDRVQPGQGFGSHPHRDMEIISYVVEGALEHKDSMGNGSVIRPGDVQCMTAGTGVRHSEYNPSDREPVHFLQIWILPERRGLAPGYEQKRFERDEKLNTFRLIGSRDGSNGSVTVHQDVDLYASVLEPGATMEQAIDANRHIWVQVIQGRARLNGTEIETGDGAAISGASALALEGVEETDLLVFDLA